MKRTVKTREEKPWQGHSVDRCSGHSLWLMKDSGSTLKEDRYLVTTVAPRKNKQTHWQDSGRMHHCSLQNKSLLLIPRSMCSHTSECSSQEDLLSVVK